MKTNLRQPNSVPAPRIERSRLGRRLLWVAALAGAVAAIAVAAGWLLPAEYRVGAAIEIPRPADRVWQVFAHPDRWSRWIPEVRSGAATSDLRDGVGSRHRIVVALPAGRELVSDIEVTEWEDGVRYAHRHLSDALDGWVLPITEGRVTVDLARLSDHACQVRISASFRADGPLARWWAFALAKPLAERALTQGLDDLRGRIRASAPEA